MPSVGAGACSHTGWEDIEEFGYSKLDWLQRSRSGNDTGCRRKRHFRICDAVSRAATGRESRYTLHLGEDGNIAVLSELEQEALDIVKDLLANWRAEREEAGLPASKQDLWAALNGELSQEEELMRRVALLMSWTYK